MELIQLWLSVEGEALDYPGIPSRSSVDLDRGRLVAEFPVEAVEIGSIAAKKKFRIDRDFEYIALLSCTPRSEPAQLIDDSGITGYVISRQEAETTRSIAWVETPLPTKPKNEDSPTHAACPLEIVDSITGAGQIAIGDGGLIRVSRDLIGKTVRARIPCYCDRRVVRLLEPLTEFTLHAVVKKEGDMQYIEAVCSPTVAASSSSVGYRRLEAEFAKFKVQSIATV